MQRRREIAAMQGLAKSGAGLLAQLDVHGLDRTGKWESVLVRSNCRTGVFADVERLATQ